jgi:hypothetical protein
MSTTAEFWPKNLILKSSDQPIPLGVVCNRIAVYERDSTSRRIAWSLRLGKSPHDNSPVLRAPQF